MNNSLIISDESIKDKICNIRGVQVILDRDLAELYEVLTRNLNKAVKRNINRFPSDFMFQLTEEEFENLKFQSGTSSWGGTRKRSFAFTEQGIATLSGILKSKKAVEVNIQIMRAFVAMRRFISKNAELFNRLDRVEIKQIEHDDHFKKVFDALEIKKPRQGIFYDGQIFDAYTFVSDIIRSAKDSIILIDNYVDDSVLTLFSKRKKGVKVIIYTKNITRQLKLDLKKYNSQYEHINIKEFKDSHDRFMIIDDNYIYHIGASLKDMGKRWFAFSRLDRDLLEILTKLI